MTTASKPLLTEDEILARFHRLRITIGLSATNFGYTVMGQPGLIKRLTEGRKLQAKNKRRCAYALDELERGHSIPMQRNGEQKENVDTRNEILDTGTVAIRSDMED